jgi:hypothetical protein
MTVPTGTFQTFQAVGNREDLTDVISDISPTETPFFSGIKRAKVTATKHEWQTDALATASATNAEIEGDDATTDTAIPTVRLGNYVQSLDKAAGRADEMDYQVMKRGKELKRDLECALSQNNGSTAGAAASAPLMGSLESWLYTNKTSVGTGTAQTTPAYASGVVAGPTDSTVTGSVTEVHLNTIIQACWTAGGEPDTILVGPATKRKISTSFTGIATQYNAVEKSKLVNVVAGADIYRSDFGTFKIVPSRFVRDRNILVLDMSMWACGFLTPFTSWDLAKTGASDRKQLYVQATLVAKNPAASGKITDINPAT